MIRDTEKYGDIYGVRARTDAHEFRLASALSAPISFSSSPLQALLFLSFTLLIRLALQSSESFLCSLSSLALSFPRRISTCTTRRVRFTTYTTREDSSMKSPRQRETEQRRARGNTNARMCMCIRLYSSIKRVTGKDRQSYCLLLQRGDSISDLTSGFLFILRYLFPEIDVLEFMRS